MDLTRTTDSVKPSRSVPVMFISVLIEAKTRVPVARDPSVPIRPRFVDPAPNSARLLVNATRTDEQGKLTFTH